MGYKEEMSVFGSYVTYLLVTLAFLALGKIEQVLQLIVAIALFYAVVFPIRTIFFKDRPKKEPHHDLISKFTANTLVSIHSGRSLILAAVLMAYFSFKPAIIILCALAVGMVCISRYLLRKHRPIDIAAGLVVGAGISLLVLNFI
jgi:membrane-associated phospholipid phosphatase